MACLMDVEAQAELTHLCKLPVSLIQEGIVVSKSMITLPLVKHTPNSHDVSAREAIEYIFHVVAPAPVEMKENLDTCCLIACLENGERRRLESTDLVSNHSKDLAIGGSLLVVDSLTAVNDTVNCDLGAMGIQTRGNNPQ